MKVLPENILRLMSPKDRAKFGNGGDVTALSEIRQATACGIRCMENHEPPDRQMELMLGSAPYNEDRIADREEWNADYHRPLADRSSYQEGCGAKIFGRPLEGNPYPKEKSPHRHSMWHQGWEDTQKKSAPGHEPCSAGMECDSFRLGHSAYENGDDFGSNPYTVGLESRSHECWSRGWKAAQETGRTKPDKTANMLTDL